MSLEFGEYQGRPLAYLRNNQPSYPDAVYLAKKWPKAFEVPDYFEHGDYGRMGSYGLSNYQVWTESFKDTLDKTWWDLGQSGILVRLDIQTKEEKEALDALSDYPLMDADHHSNLEMEMQNEAWNDWGRSDFKRDLNKKAEDEEDEKKVEALLDIVPNKVFDTATYRMYEENGNYPEGSDDISFPYGDFVQQYDGTLTQLLEFLDLASASVTLRLADTAFTSWQIENGEKVRRLRIKKSDLPEQLSNSQRAALIRNSEALVPFDEAPFLCDTLYIECEYPWETEEESEDI